ncbi:hypothetical protein V6N13_009620 [Hibiscus sabdariffa]
MASVFFHELFQSSSPSDAAAIYEKVHPRITSVLNDYLLPPFEADEIWNAVKCMAPLKASGPDGFPTLFFQKYWDVIGTEITLYCLSVLNGETDLETISDTRIVLIPKVRQPL